MGKRHKRDARQQKTSGAGEAGGANRGARQSRGMIDEKAARQLTRLLFAACLALVCLRSGATLYNAVVRIADPYALENGEGYVLHYVQRLAQGRGIYVDVHHEPYMVCTYPPLYMLLNAPFVRWAGCSWASGRIVSGLASLWVAAIVFLVIRRESDSPWLAALLGGCLFSTSVIAGTMVKYRVDGLAVSLSLTGVYVLWRHGTRAWPWAVAAFLASLYTKHSMVAAPLAALVWMLMNDRRAAVKFAVALGLSGLGIFLVLDLWTKGQFHLHLITYTRGDYFWRMAGLYTAKLFEWSWPFVIGGCVGWAVMAVNGVRSWDVFAFYFAAGALTLLSTGRRGASRLYLIEVIPLFLIFSGRLAIWLTKRNDAIRPWGTFAALALLLVYLAGFERSVWSLDDPKTDPTRKRDQQILRLVSETRGPILAEDFSYLLLAGKEVVFEPFPITAIARAGLWDSSDLIRRIRGREFDMILLESSPRTPNFLTRDRFEAKVLAAMAETYTREVRVADRLLLFPRPPEAPPASASAPTVRP